MTLPLVVYENDLHALVGHVLSLPDCVGDLVAKSHGITRSSRRIIVGECARAYRRVKLFAGRHMWGFRYAFEEVLKRLTYRPGLLIGERPEWVWPGAEEFLREQTNETAVLDSIDDLKPDAAFAVASFCGTVRVMDRGRPTRQPRFVGGPKNSERRREAS